MSAKELALAAKTRGNDAFTKGDFSRAVSEFSEAIAHDSTDAVFYSNRSGAYASLKQFDKALEDANKCVEINPNFVKGYSRKGVALFGLNRLNEAKQVYEAGLKLDPNAAALKEGLAEIETKLRAPPQNPLSGLFGPDMYVKLNANPETREYMKDPSFVSKIQMLQTNPNAMGNMLSDPRLSKALGVLLGVDISAMGAGAAGRGGAGSASASGSRPGGSTVIEDEEDEDMDEEGPSGSVREEKKGGKKFTHVGDMTPEEARAAREASFKAAQKPAEPEKELTEEEKKELAEREAAAQKEREEKAAKAKIRAQADAAKNAGNEHYKRKEFPQAISKYEEAITIDPANIVYYNNLSAVFMEQKEYQKAIETATKGVTIGKENMANYVDVAKAYARIASAYQALGNLDAAIEYYNKSLLEDYQDKTKTALKKLEEEKKRQEQLAYIDPAKSEEHKTKGNELYNAGKFKEAIDEYSEAIKRDPKNYKVYSNRAACYTKLMDWGRGLEDCEKCLAMDPKFVKAYIRKGKIQHFLKQYHKALSTFDQALAIEPTNQEVMEAKRTTLMAIQSGENDPERAKEAMKDPEIQAIMRDPVIAKVLQDMQQSPQAGAQAMRDPDIRRKIEMLIAAGVLGVK